MDKKLNEKVIEQILKMIKNINIKNKNSFEEQQKILIFIILIGKYSDKYENINENLMIKIFEEISKIYNNTELKKLQNKIENIDENLLNNIENELIKLAKLEKIDEKIDEKEQELLKKIKEFLSLANKNIF